MTGDAYIMLVTFSGGQAINISFVYTLDAYGPVAGEVTIAQLAFKCKCPLHRPLPLQHYQEYLDPLFNFCFHLTSD